MSLTFIEAAIGVVGRPGTSASVVIGSVALTRAELPDTLRVGGQQRLVILQLLDGWDQLLGQDRGILVRVHPQWRGHSLWDQLERSLLIGSDATSAISTLTNAISDVSTTVENFSSELSTVVGQLTPLVTLIGAGSGLP